VFVCLNNPTDMTRPTPSPAAVTLVLHAGFITCTLWLVYTASPKARARSCGGNKLACMRYSCDFGWDIFWGILWAVALVLCSISREGSRGTRLAGILISAIMTAIFITTAVLTSKVRCNLPPGTASTWKDKDIEAQAHPAVKPISSAAPTVQTAKA